MRARRYRLLSKCIVKRLPLTNPGFLSLEPLTGLEVAVLNPVHARSGLNCQGVQYLVIPDCFTGQHDLERTKGTRWKMALTRQGCQPMVTLYPNPNFGPFSPNAAQAKERGNVKLPATCCLKDEGNSAFLLDGFANLFLSEKSLGGHSW